MPHAPCPVVRSGLVHSPLNSEQVLVRIHNCLNTHDEMHAVRTQVLAEVKRAQMKLLPELADFHVVDRQQGFFPTRLTGGDSHGKGD